MVPLLLSCIFAEAPTWCQVFDLSVSLQVNMASQNICCWYYYRHRQVERIRNSTRITTEKKNYWQACINNNKVSRVSKVMKSRETRYIHVHEFTRAH